MQKIALIKKELSYGYNEEVKQLRTNLVFSGTDKKVVLVTSTTEDEGKSTVCLSLARSLASLHKSVLLIDADLRKSVTSNIVEDPSLVKVGLAHYLSGQNSTDDIIFQTDEKGFFMVFAGPIVPPNPAELVAGPKMAQLIEVARKVFDYVIIDCPPLLVVDALVIAPVCDGSILVVETNKISYKVLQKDVDELEATGVPILGAVLNKVNYRGKGRYYYKKYGYGYGGKYGYGYGYGYGREPSSKKKSKAKASK